MSPNVPAKIPIKWNGEDLARLYALSNDAGKDVVECAQRARHGLVKLEQIMAGPVDHVPYALSQKDEYVTYLGLATRSLDELIESVQRPSSVPPAIGIIARIQNWFSS
jgi:hypothetical protein